MSTATTESKQETTWTQATWPAPDFEAQVQRLRGELETAVRVEKDATLRVEQLQEKADARNLPLSMFKDEVAKLNAEQSLAIIAVHEKRNEMRKLLEFERAKFFALKEEAALRLQPEITAKFLRAKQAAQELQAVLSTRLGAKSEIEFQERQIAAWNRLAKRINRAIPRVNAHVIPGVGYVSMDESLRGAIEQMFFKDAATRELCRGIIGAEGEKRQNAELRAGQLEKASESQRQPILNEPPFHE